MIIIKCIFFFFLFLFLFYFIFFIIYIYIYITILNLLNILITFQAYIVISSERYCLCITFKFVKYTKLFYFLIFIDIFYYVSALVDNNMQKELIIFYKLYILLR